ncbi:mitochondrial carrier [Peniophora sp. CONT]|nr:mitochondrial carrier [Peniophora sp. CONT]
MTSTPSSAGPSSLASSSKPLALASTASPSTTVTPEEAEALPSPAPPPVPDPARPPAPKPSSRFLSPEITSYFIAGGIAGAASRTVVSPLERLKIIQQVQQRGSAAAYEGVAASLARMWREEGFAGFMRGNGINCVRIIPYSAVQFTTYEQLKKLFTNNGTRQLDTPTRLAAGALAGITSVCSTYPLDLIRSRLSIATASLNAHLPPTTPTASAALSSSPPPKPKPQYTAAELTMWGMGLKVFREEGGLRALYRGIMATAAGVAPYVGINFAAYEALRGYITPPGKQSAWRKLACGALAGSISQTLTYPFDVLRRKMQVSGMRNGGMERYDGALSAARHIVRTEGLAGMYRGLWPNLLKVAPSIATSFFTYELAKDFLVGRNT